MWNPYQRYRTLDFEARKLLWRAVALLPLISCSLRLRGFQKTKEKLQRKILLSLARNTAKENTSEAVQKTCRVVRAGAHYGIVRPTCLVESMALWYLLQRQGIPVILRMGVHKLPDRFEAHAWVEYEGEALNQTEELHRHYAVFDSEFSDLPGEKL